MKHFVPYRDFMDAADAYLEINLDLSDPIEITDFAALFAGFGAEFERYLTAKHPEYSGTARMYVSEVRKGSVVAQLFADIPDLIGLADAALIVLAFGALFNRRLRDLVRGKHLDGAKKPQLSDMSKTIRAIANDKKGNVTIKGLRLKDGVFSTEYEAVFSEKDARNALKTIQSQKEELDSVSASDHERVLMVYTRSNVGHAVIGKRSGERVIVSDISENTLALMYGSDLVEAQIKDEIKNADENIFKRGFVVDLNLIFFGPRPVYWRRSGCREYAQLRVQKQHRYLR